MKQFFTENSKIIGKLVLNQFGATFFGIMLLLAASSSGNLRTRLELFASIFATLFYLFLLYNVLWEKGGQDRIKIDGGRAVKSPLKGLYIALVANIPNFILAALVIVSDPFKATHIWAGNLNFISRIICLLWEGMYAGIVAFFAPNNPLIHLVDIFPALLICELAYYLGLNNKKILGFLSKKKS